MGSSTSLFLCCPLSYLKEERLLYKGNNSAIYRLPSQKLVCKVSFKRLMYEQEKEFMLFMKKHPNAPNIVRFHALIPRHSILLMEQAECDLLHWIDTNYKQPFYLEELANFLGQMAKGFRFLCQHHIEHYDIKPDNLLLVNGVLKIADFGASRINRDRYASKCGTYGFMAPEVAGCSNTDFYVPHSMDVYSICIMLSYLYIQSIFIKFYKRKWNRETYMSLEKYIHDKYPLSFIRRGLVVDQRYRMSMDELLTILQEDPTSSSEKRICSKETITKEQEVREQPPKVCDLEPVVEEDE